MEHPTTNSSSPTATLSECVSACLTRGEAYEWLRISGLASDAHEAHRLMDDAGVWFPETLAIEQKHGRI